MAVFKQELNWSYYQNEQMKVLENIEKSFSQSLQVGQHLVNSMSKIEYAITSIAYASESSAKNIAAFTKDLTGSAVEFTSRMDKASDIAEKFTFQLSESGKRVEDSNNRMSSSGAKTASAFLNIATTAWQAIGGLEGIGKEADKFSDASNQMIKLSGVSGDMVREFRSELMSIVADLNLSTGSAFNPLESYKQIISISQGVTSDLEAIGEMARPLLLAQETLDVNINTIADLFNRFYVRYSFSSTNMEDALNEIRGNTAGNSANAEATVENIQALENWINVIAKDDNAKREQMLEEISHYTSWIESMGGDSAAYTNYMKSIAYGDWNSNPELLHILNLAGSNATEAQNMFNSGDFGKLTELLFTGVGGVADKALSTSVSGRAFDNYGLDRDLGMSTKNILDSSNFTSFEDFLESVSGASPTMEQLTEDKYVSLADKTNNWLAHIYEKVSMIQEYLPFGLSDIASLVYLFRGSGGSNLGSLSNMIGSTGNSMVGGSGILGKLASGGYNMVGGAATSSMSGGAAAGLGALGATGVAAGVGMGIYGGVEAYKNFKEGNNGLGAVNTVGAVGGAVGAGALTASLLGAGAAAGPIGWAALAVGGIALVGAKAYEAAHAYEDAGKVITTQYKDARASFLKEAAYRESYLEDIQVLLDDESNADEARNKLLQSGLLSEEEMQKLRKGEASNQIEAMKELTEAYLIAAGKFSDTTQDLLDKYEKKDRDAATATAQSIKEWYDSNKNVESETNAAIMEDMVFAIEKQLSGKENLSKDEQWFMDELNKNRSLGRTSQKDWEYLLDKGTNLSLLYNNVTGTELENFVNKANKKGAGFTDYKSFVDPTMIQKYITPIVVASTKEEAEKALKAAKSAGIKKEDYYDEIVGAMEKFGIPEYARGTNYVHRDQVAVVHEGEAIIPKKYNPAANPTDTRALASKMDRERLEMREFFINFIEELQEIKEFLSVWKEDNDKQSRINSAKSRTESTRSYIRSYMST